MPRNRLAALLVAGLLTTGAVACDGDATEEPMDETEEPMDDDMDEPMDETEEPMDDDMDEPMDNDMEDDDM